MADVLAGEPMPNPPRSQIPRRVSAFFVVLASIALLALEANPLADLVQQADPTLQGTFSFLNARPLLSVAAHGALILIALHRFLPSSETIERSRIAAGICYGALAVELLSLAPCLPARDALCGVFYILVSPITAIVILVGCLAYLAQAASRVLVRVFATALVLATGAALGAYWRLTPKTATDCSRIVEPIKRDTCLMNFALRSSDAELCDKVNFDSSRWSCTYQIAERKGDATLCERIALPCRHISPGLACTPEFYRNTCFLIMARKLRDPRLCERVTEDDPRTRCMQQAK